MSKRSFGISKGLFTIDDFMRSSFFKLFRFIAYPNPGALRVFNFANREDYLFLPEMLSVKRHIYFETISFFFLVIILVATSLYSIYHFFDIAPLIVVSAAIALFYFLLMLFKLFVVYKSFSGTVLDFSDEEIAVLKDEELPVYTILIPLYQEAEVIMQIKQAMCAIDYPKEKLDIIITLEEYDHETITAIHKAELPPYFKTLILPNVKPKTKPKALNVAFLKTVGEYLVIYDAEIVPEPDQLKKAYLAFKKNPELGSVQTRLDHYNANQTLITKLFNTEFSFHYDLFLPGLDHLGLPIPLSGHSTHFKREVLSHIGAWDPYNVTEDCDVGMRLHRLGYKTALINSLSFEEATSTWKPWLYQRTRWMKGFIQTAIVHLRHPFKFMEEIGGLWNFIAFIFIVPGTVIVNVLNLAYWFIFTLWLLTHSTLIQNFFPGPVLYMSAVSFIVGNFIFTYLNLLGAYKRDRFDLVKYSLLSPIYWIMLAIASLRACVQIIHKPHAWEKTRHGDHMKKGGLFSIQTP